MLNQQSSGGDGPCHIVTDKQGKHVLAANYGGGSVCALPIQDDGKLGEATAFIQHKGSGPTPAGRRARTGTRSTSMPRTSSPLPPTSVWTRCWSTATTRPRER